MIPIYPLEVAFVGNTGQFLFCQFNKGKAVLYRIIGVLGDGRWALSTIGEV